MGKNSRNMLLLVCLIVFIMSIGAIWILLESQGRVFAQGKEGERFVTKREFEQVLTLEERQPIYMKGPALTQIGVLESNQPVAVTGEDEAYYELRLGNMTAFVRKGQATVEKKKLSTLVHTERLAAVHTLQKTAVYEDADLQSSVILEMEEGYRYPVVREEEDWYTITIGERPGYISKQSVTLDEGLPVLLYHQVLPRELMSTMESTISLESFEQQMGYLADHHFETLTAHQLYDYLEGRLVVPSKAVLITFDDGLLSTKEYAYPILKQYGFSALQHIISSRTGRAQGAQLFDAEGPLQFFTAADLEKLADVFQFEAHTYELHSLNKVSGVGIALDRSKEEILLDLQQNIEQVPAAVSLAYPYGHYNEDFIAAAKEAGVLIGFTTTEGYANRKTSNYEVCRYGITEKKSFEQFVAYVLGDMTWP
ncbi:polysaccharide deacetylase family protein [Sporosarcina sp. ANT_H38]|uniref:polysaccharide deacetylase family protein n=1 Tax=Sporosarcina sp. ANT_H38 TaxID=2597358 RepID=UPI0011F24AF4|nr:polysaccharide deacetylase family protein [Sporosarcina sp. ANT_H38]KAA0966387.1 polysaccharide deacetylase family protein [Sporosarcina sp. ANT_H38]